MWSILWNKNLFYAQTFALIGWISLARFEGYLKLLIAVAALIAGIFYAIKLYYEMRLKKKEYDKLK